MARYEQLLDRYEDALFTLLMEKAIEEDGKEFLAENERLKNDPEAAIPADFDRQCIKTIHQAFRRKKRRRAGRAAYRVFRQAAIAVLVAALLFATAFAVFESVRSATLNFIIDTFDDHLEFRFREDPPAADDDTSDFQVGWLPDGFELSDSGGEWPEIWLEYANPGGGQIGISTYYQPPDSAEVLAVDSEGAIIEHAAINGFNAEIITKDDIQIVIPIEEYSLIIYVLGEYVPMEDMIKIAESLSY